MGRLTTHVLDLVRGMPAVGMTIELAAIDGAHGRRVLVRTATNRDGRCDAPLLDDEAFTAGTWQLEFHVARYFQSLGGGAPAAQPFLDVVIVRFNVADPAQHHHVPLLVTPWAYSTYRGS